jgi:hypothetical protein
MDLQPIGPTRHYVIVCHDGGRIDAQVQGDAGYDRAARLVAGVRPWLHHDR